MQAIIPKLDDLIIVDGRNLKFSDVLPKLSNNEKSELVHKSKQKRLEWSLGRIAAKQAVTDDMVSISYRESGAPFSLRSDGTEMNVSISHSNLVSVAGAREANKKIGVDIEKIRSFKPQTISWFMSDREYRKHCRLPERERDIFATLVWSTKESYLKLLELGLRKHPQKIELDFDLNRDKWTLLSLSDKSSSKNIKIGHNWKIYDNSFIVSIVFEV